MELTLDQIGIEYQTDKASQFSRTYAKPHDYLRHMEQFFAPMRNEPIRLVEIGVGGGESVRTWLYYFLCAEVIGIDNVSGTNEWNAPKQLGVLGKDYEPGDMKGKYRARYAFHAADQTDFTFWKCFAADYGQSIDIAVDDGAHSNDATIISFQGLWPLLKPGALYCIEDLATSYGSDPYFQKPGYPSQMTWLKDMLDAVIRNTGGVDSIYFAPELCIIRKKLCTPS